MRRAGSATTSSVVTLYPRDRSAESKASQALPGNDLSIYHEQLHPAFFVVWAASLACVAGAFYRHETLGAEATLALITAVGITWYAIAARRLR